MLARWPGFGAISEVFDEDRAEYAAVREQLHALTTDEEYAALRRSTRNAHYTDAGYVQVIWEAMAGLGFTGGEVFEPGCGSGHFIGLAPPGAHMTGVERDPVTAAITRYLYPEANVMTGSFADTRLPAASFDAAVGNVPFGKTKLRDPVYNGSGLLSMHDHFIVKSLALTRPGGIVALLTSRYTMDARNPQARRQIAEMADLVTAVRLPSGAHRRAAGTDAVTDLMILRRRMPGEPFITGQPWEKSLPVDLPGGQVHVNEYFTARPEMVLGQMQAGTGMYSNTELAVKGDRDATAALRAALEETVARANDAGLVMTGPPAAGPAPGPRPAVAAGLMPDPIPGMIRAHSNGTFTRVIDVYDDGTTSEQPFQVPKTQAAELRRLLRLRDLARTLIRAERDSADDTTEISGLRDKLNREYDSYVRLHGPVKRFKWGKPRAKPAQPAGTGDGEAEDQAEQEQTASRVPPPQGGFRKDPYHHAAYALEKSYDPVTGTAVKQDIFTQRVIAPPQPLLGADTPEEALAICLSQHGGLRLDVIARLLGLPGAGQAREELGTLVYDDPEAGTPVWAPLYLSGNVRKKLTAARAAAETDSRFEVNVAALAEVVPRDRGPAEIEAQLGAGWIDPVYVQQFIRDILGEDDTTPKPTTVKQSKGGYWHVSDGSTTSVAAVSTWGTSRLCAQELLERLLKGTAEHIRLTVKEDKDSPPVYDPEATEAAKAKGRQIAARFSSWVWEDPDRAAALCRAFNNAWASRVAPDFDNVRLVLPGLSPLIKLRPNQIPGIARIIFQDSAGMVQDTGAGKTKITVIGMHERHRLGLAPKPCIVVQRGKLSDWRDEWLECYPGAKLLVADTPDLRGDKRREFVAQCATGNPDAIILSREAFTKIGVSNETHAEFIRRELGDLREALEDAREDGIRWTVKQIETRIENAEERLEKWASEIGHDAGLTIEDTGITDIAVDEAQGYRVGPLTSAIPGESAKGSDRARDLLEKAYYLKKWLGSTRLTLLSARPFVNRLSELYVWLRYLDEDVGPYDPFCRTFAKMLPGYEMTPDGSFKVRSRLREVINAPDMHLLLRGKSDFKLYGHGLNLQLPRLRGGKPQITAVDATGAHAEYTAYLKERIRLLPGGPPEKGNDIWIAVQNDAIKAALDLRLVYRDTGEPQKALVTARKIWDEWLTARDNVYLQGDGTEHPVKGGLILCFASLGVPGDHEGWNFYDEVRGLLIKWGMPPNLVRYIQEARDMRELEDIYHGARNGGIHVLFASTQKGGEGLNVQNRCVGGVHVTSPWNWDEPDQEKGRYDRPGNQNEEVFCHRIVTAPSCDALKWQRAKDKRDAFYKLMTGEIDGRTIRVPDDDLTPAELIAASSGDPRHIERARLEATIARLDMVHTDWARNQSTLTYRAQSARTAAARHERDIVAVDAALKRRKDTRGDAFAMTVNGRRYAKRPEAGAALTQQITQHVDKALAARSGDRNSTHPIGELGGFGVTLKINLDAYFGAPVELHLDGIPDLGDPVAIPSIDSLDQLDGDSKLRGLVTRLENRIAGLENTRAQLTAQATARRREAEAAETETGTEFPQEAELTQLRAQLEELEADLFAEALAAENDTGPDPGTDTTGVAGDQDTDQVRPALPRRHANLEQAAAGAVSRARSSGYTCYVYPDGDRITCSGQRPATAAHYSVTPRGSWSRHMEGAVFDIACPWPHGQPEDLGHFFRVIAGRPAAATPVTHPAAAEAAAATTREAASTGQPWHLYPDGDGYTSCGKPPAHAAYFTVAPNRQWTRRMHGTAADTGWPTEQDLISIAGEVASPDWTAAHPFAREVRRLRHNALASEQITGLAAGNDPDQFAAGFWDWAQAHVTQAAGPDDPSGFAAAYAGDPSFAADVTATVAGQAYRLLGNPEPRDADAADRVLRAEACRRAAAAARAAISEPERVLRALAGGRDNDLDDAVTIDMHLARAGIPAASRRIILDSDAGCYAVDLAGEEDTRFRLAIPPPGAAYTIRPGDAPAITLPALRGHDGIAGLLLSHAGLTRKDPAAPPKPPDYMEELAGRHGMHVTREGGETIIRDPGNMPVLRGRDGQLENRPGRVIPAARAAAYVAAAAESPQDHPDVLYARVVSGAPVSDGMPDEQAVRSGDYHHARDGAAGRASRAAATCYVYADGHAYVTTSTPPPAAAYLSVTAEGLWASRIDGETSYLARPPGPHDFSAVCGKLAAPADTQQTPPAPAGHETEPPSQQAPAAAPPPGGPRPGSRPAATGGYHGARPNALEAPGAPATGNHSPGGTPAAAGDPLAPWQELARPHGLTAMHDEEYPGGILIRRRDDPPSRFALCQPAPGDSVLNQNGRPVPVPRMAAYLAAYAADPGAAPDQLYTGIAPQAAGERSFPGNDRLTARDTAADQATRTRGSWHLYAHGQALVCTSREPGNGPYFTVTPGGQWSAHGGAPFLPAGRPPDPVKFIALISQTPARHEVHPATVPAAGAAGGEEPPAGSLVTLAAAHGMHARVHDGTTLVFRSEVRAGQPVLRQDSPSGPLLNQPGRIIPEEHTGAYLATAARDDTLNADDLYQAVIPGAAAREEAWPRARGHVTTSTAAIQARETGQPWAVYVDGQAAVAAPRPPASGAAYYLVTPSGQDVHWTRHLDGETEPVSHQLRPQDLSVIAGEAATAPGPAAPPAQRQPPAQPPPRQAPPPPGAAQDPDDWTATHPLATGIEAMRQAALADTRLGGVARANPEDNFGLVFKDWADGYVAGLYPDPGSAAPAAPPFADTYFDDLPFRDRLIPTLRHQVHQALHDSPAPGPQADDGNPPAPAHPGPEPEAAPGAVDLLPYASGPELAAGQLATARAWQLARRAGEAAPPRGDTGQAVSRYFENTGALLQQAETAVSAQDAIRGYGGTAEAADRIAGATTDPGCADYYYPLRAAARQLAGAARQHAGRMTAAGPAAQELFTDPDARDARRTDGHTDPLGLLPAPYPSGTEAGEARTAIFNLARDAQAASDSPSLPESVTRVYSRLGALHVLPDRDHLGDRIASWRELPAAVFTALADLPHDSPAAAPLAGLARAVTSHWLRLDSYRLRAGAAASPYDSADSYTAGAAVLRQAWTAWRQSPTGSRLAELADRDARGSDLLDQRDAHRRLQAEHYQLGAHDPGTGLEHASTRAAATAHAAYALLLNHRPADFQDRADQALLHSLTEAAYLHAAQVDAARGAGTAPVIAAGLAAQEGQTPPDPARAEPAPSPEADPSPPAGLVIEHHHAGTVVRGTDKTDLPLHKVLHDARFKFSKRLDFWYLPRPWPQDTRERYVRKLTAGLGRLGRQYALQDHPSETAAQAAPAPIQAGEPYSGRSEAQQDYQRAKRAWWAMTDTDAGRRMFSYARQKRPDVLALQAAERALPAGADLAGTAAELAPGLTAWALAAQILLDNLTAERHRAPKFRAQLEALTARTRALAARIAGTAAQGGFPGDPRQPPAAGGVPAGDSAASAPAMAWPPGHPHAAQLAVMITAFHNDTGTAAAAIRGSVQAGDRQNFDAAFTGWARTYLSRTAAATITPAAATSAPPPDWARKFMDDQALTAAMTSAAAGHIWDHLGGATGEQAARTAPGVQEHPAAQNGADIPPGAADHTGPPDSEHEPNPPTAGGAPDHGADGSPHPPAGPPAAPGGPDGRGPEPDHGIARVTVLHGHTSPGTAYVVDDYPYGRRLRCQIRYWLETAEKGQYRGQTRLVHQTTNPRQAGHPWNKQHPDQYHPWAVMYLNADGHVKLRATGSWGPDPALDALIHLDGTYDQLTTEERGAYGRQVQISLRGNSRGWDDWRKALEFIRGYRESHRTLPDAAQVRDTPGFHLRDPEISVALAAVTAGLGGPHAAPPRAAEQAAAQPEAPAATQPDTPSEDPPDSYPASQPAAAPDEPAPQAARPTQPAAEPGHAITGAPASQAESTGNAPPAAAPDLPQTRPEDTGGPLTPDEIKRGIRQWLGRGVGGGLPGLAAAIGSNQAMRGWIGHQAANADGYGCFYETDDPSLPSGRRENRADSSPAGLVILRGHPGRRQETIGWEEIPAWCHTLTAEQRAGLAETAAAVAGTRQQQPGGVPAGGEEQARELRARLTELTGQAWEAFMAAPPPDAAQLDQARTAYRDPGPPQGALFTVEPDAAPAPDTEDTATALATENGPDSPAASPGAAPRPEPAAPAPAAGSGLPDGTQPLAAHTPWGGSLRPERLLYGDGTQLTVRGQGDEGDQAWTAAAAGMIPAGAGSDYGDGRLQVVRWDDGSYAVVHPALTCPRDTDPYAGLSDRDRARWETFDAAEAFPTPVAGLAARLVDPGDVLQVDRGPRSRTFDMRKVQSIAPGTGPYADGFEVTVEGARSPLYYPQTHRPGVFIPAEHPSLAQAIRAVTTPPGEDAPRDAAAADMPGAAVAGPAPAPPGGPYAVSASEAEAAGTAPAPGSLLDPPQQPPTDPAPDPAAASPQPPPARGQQGAAGTGTSSPATGQGDIPQQASPGTDPPVTAPASGEPSAQLADPVPDPGPGDPMRFMNSMDIEEAADRWQDHPVLGPATRTLASLEAWTDANSDGWAYWPKPSRAAGRLMSLIERDGTARYLFDTDRADATPAELAAAYKPIKAFRTRHQADFAIETPEESAPPDGLFPAPAETGPRQDQARAAGVGTSPPAQRGPGRPAGPQPGRTSEPATGTATPVPAPDAATVPGGTSEQDPGPGTPKQADGGPPGEVRTSVVPSGTPAAPEPREAGQLAQRIRIDTSTSRPAISGTDYAHDPPELRAALRRHHFEWRKARQQWEYTGDPAAASGAVTAIRGTLADLDSNTATTSPPDTAAGEIIAAALQGRSLAFTPPAGTDSTAVLAQVARELAQRSPATRILYLAPGTGAAPDQFPGRVTCTPLHSLAGQALARTSYAAKVRNLGAGARTAQQWARILAIPDQTPTSAGAADAGIMAQLAMRAISEFRNSSDDAPGPQHLPPSAGQYPDLARLAVTYAQAAWDNITAPRNARLLTGDDPGALVVTRGDLVKIWALTQPQLDTDVILADAAHITTEAARHIIAAQHGQVIVAGESGPWLAANAAARSRDPGQRVPAWDALPAGLPGRDPDQEEPGPAQASAGQAVSPREGDDAAPLPAGTAGPDLDPDRLPAAPGPQAGDILEGVQATSVTHQIIALAQRGGLRPHLDGDGPRKGAYRVIVNGEGTDAIFGAIYVGSSTGKVLRGVLTHGNNGTEKTYTTVADVRAVLTAWLRQHEITPADVPGQGPGTDPEKRPVIPRAERAELRRWTRHRDELHAAFGYLAGLTAGYAPTGEGPGFTAADTYLGHFLADVPVIRWGHLEAHVAWDMLRDYTGQLAQAGITFEDLPRPPGAYEMDVRERAVPRDLAEQGVRIIRHDLYQPGRGFVRCDGPGADVILGIPDGQQALAAEAATLPGAARNPDSHAIALPHQALPAVVTLAARHGVTITPEVRALAAVTAGQPGPPAHPAGDPSATAGPPSAPATAEATSPSADSGSPADTTAASMPGDAASAQASPGPAGPAPVPGPAAGPVRRPVDGSDLLPADVLAAEAEQVRRWNTAVYTRADAGGPQPAAPPEDGPADTESAGQPPSSTDSAPPAGPAPDRPEPEQPKGHNSMTQQDQTSSLETPRDTRPENAGEGAIPQAPAQPMGPHWSPFGIDREADERALRNARPITDFAWPVDPPGADGTPGPDGPAPAAAEPGASQPAGGTGTGDPEAAAGPPSGVPANGAEPSARGHREDAGPGRRLQPVPSPGGTTEPRLVPPLPRRDTTWRRQALPGRIASLGQGDPAPVLLRPVAGPESPDPPAPQPGRPPGGTVTTDPLADAVIDAATTRYEQGLEARNIEEGVVFAWLAAAGQAPAGTTTGWRAQVAYQLGRLTAERRDVDPGPADAAGASAGSSHAGDAISGRRAADHDLLVERIEQLEEQVAALRADATPPPAREAAAPDPRWQRRAAGADAVQRARETLGQAVPALRDNPVWRRTGELLGQARRLASDALHGLIAFRHPERARRAWDSVWARTCEVTGELAGGLMRQLSPGGRAWTAARSLRHAATEGVAHARGWLPRGERLPPGSYEPPAGRRARTWVTADAATRPGAGPLSSLGFPAGQPGVRAPRHPRTDDLRRAARARAAQSARTASPGL